MSSPPDAAMSGDGMSRDQLPASEPFTVAENIQQLNDIDQCIVQLMNHTATALKSLTIPSSSTASDPTVEASQPHLDPTSQKQDFRSATDSFVKTLHSIDVRMKRQIFALEEAGIVNLSTPLRQDRQAQAKASLKPSGVGTIGKLDVGWLNSRGSRVERDMEGELWSKAKDLLSKEAGNKEKT
ncbi:hypothetical protein G7046_g9484 [Stylonectria norvegica]|nr:hypothetical protein G7046_g9484 [Stylonectria norvegica]